MDTRTACVVCLGHIAPHHSATHCRVCEGQVKVACVMAINSLDMCALIKYPAKQQYKDMLK